jgi:hypothetical protein
MCLERPDPFANDGAKGADVLVAHRRSNGWLRMANAMARAPGTSGDGSAMSNNEYPTASSARAVR